MSPPQFKHRSNNDRRYDHSRDPRQNHYQNEKGFNQRRYDMPPPGTNWQKSRANNPQPTNPFHAKFQSNPQTRPTNNLINQNNDPRLPKVSIVDPQRPRFNPPQPSRLNQPQPSRLNQPQRPTLNQPQRPTLNQPQPSKLNQPQPSPLNRPQPSTLNQPQTSSDAQNIHSLLNAFSTPHNNQMSDPSHLRNFSPQSALSPNLEHQPSAPISTFQNIPMGTPPIQPNKTKLMLNEQIETLTKQNEEARKNLEEYAKKNACMSDTMSQNSIEIKDLKQKLDNMDHEKKEMEQKHKQELHEKSLRKNDVVKQYEELKQRYINLEKLKKTENPKDGNDLLQEPSAKKARTESTDSNGREDFLKKMLQDRIDELEKTDKLKDEEIERLKKASTSNSSKCNNSECQSKLNELDRSKKDLILNHSKEVTRLTQQLNKSRDEHSSTCGLLAKTKNELTKKERQHEEELNSKNQEMQEFVNKHNSLVAEYNGLVETHDTLETENKRLDEIISQLGSKDKEYQKIESNLKVKLGEIQNELNKVAAKSNDEYTILVSKTNAALETERSKLKKQVDENANLKSQLDEKSNSISNLQIEISNLNQKVYKLENETLNSSTELLKMVENYKTRFQQLETQFNENLSTLKTKNEGLMNSNNALEALRCKMAAKLTELTTELKNLRSELAVERSEITKRNQTIQDNNILFVHLKQQLDSKIQECQQLNFQADSWRKKYYSFSKN